MKLTIIKYSQNDDRWRTIKINNTTSSIGDYGCYMTCIAMFLKYRGYDETPKSLNEKFTNNLCYKGDLIDGPKVAELYKGSFNGIEQFDIKPAPLDRIKALIDQGKPIIVEVDGRPSVEGKQSHFVLVIGYEGDSLIINDPWDGTECKIEDKYPNSNPHSASSTITGLRIYEFPQLKEQEVNDELNKIIQFLKEQNSFTEGKVREAFGALIDKPNFINTISTLNEKIKSLESNQEENLKLIDELRKKIDEISLINGNIQKLATDWQTKCLTANELLDKKNTELDELYKKELELNDKIVKLTIESSKEITLSKFIELIINKLFGNNKK